MPEGLLNGHRLADDILTAGQPTPEQLARLAAEGVRLVVNLALPTSSGALPDERTTVTTLGMDYRHVPVVFESPRREDYLEFEAIMDARGTAPVLVHCALNYRASAFMSIYRVRRLSWEPAAARKELESVWKPDAVWTAFIDGFLG
jgi:uncharacterized protein (TIGR01244 family)